MPAVLTPIHHVQTNTLSLNLILKKPPPSSKKYNFPYTTLFRSRTQAAGSRTGHPGSRDSSGGQAWAFLNRSGPTLRCAAAVDNRRAHSVPADGLQNTVEALALDRGRRRILHGVVIGFRIVGGNAEIQILRRQEAHSGQE